jgi:hypothetical protein
VKFAPTSLQPFAGRHVETGEDGMAYRDSRIQSQLVARAIAAHRSAVAQAAPLDTRGLLAAAKRLSAAAAPDARASR